MKNKIKYLEFFKVLENIKTAIFVIHFLNVKQTMFLNIQWSFVSFIFFLICIIILFSFKQII